MKLVCLNLGIRISNTQKIIDFLKEEQADIVAAQEVTRHLSDNVYETFRTKADIEAALNTDYPHTFFGPSWVADGFKKSDTVEQDFGGHIEQGLELLSKYPITSGTNEFYYKHFEYMQDWSNWKNEDHGRSLLITTLNVNGKPLQIINLHGIWTKDKVGDVRTELQCKYIVEASKRHNIATIIAGDFNLVPSSPSLNIINQEFRNLITEYGYSSTRPDFNDGVDTGDNIVDYIFVNNLVSVNDFKVIKSDVSDHLPLMIDFDI